MNALSVVLALGLAAFGPVLPRLISAKSSAASRKSRLQGQAQILSAGLRHRSQDACWLVFDGDTLYVDRNGNGDLTEKTNG